jgi:uncharacterized protein YycO
MEFLMRKSLVVFAVICMACSGAGYQPRNGDIVFQDLKTASSEAIKAATESPYSHCGIVKQKGDGFVVIEAVGPVREIDLESWIADGDGHFSAFRLKENAELGKAITVAEHFLGLPYDHVYAWGDDEFYCSELVYKAYRRGCGISLCEPKQVDAYSLGLIDKRTRESLDSTFLQQRVVAPGDLARSEMLELIYSNMENTGKR